MKQKLVKSKEKIRLFVTVFGAQRYRNDYNNFSFFPTHIQFHRPRRLGLTLISNAENCETHNI